MENPQPSNVGPLRKAWRSDARVRFSRNWLGVASVVFLLVFFVAIIVLPTFLQDPNLASPVDRLQAPSGEHWLGTDDVGRDVFARVIDAGRVSMFVAVMATLVAVGIGMILGVVMGYVGGVVDTVIARTLDILISFPLLLTAVLLSVALGPSTLSVIVAVGLSQVPVYGRLFRASVVTVRSREYVQGAVSLGFGAPRIVWMHILPSVIVPILVVVGGRVGLLSLAEAALSFLGAGVQPPNASWGNMIADGQAYLQITPLIAVAPGSLMMLVGLAFSFLSDALRDAFNVREVAVSKVEAGSV